MRLEEIYCHVDDFCKAFFPAWERSLIAGKKRQRARATSLSMSELITIMILFQTSNYRTFKHFYIYLLQFHRRDFPNLVSYSRFVQLIPRVLVPVMAFLQSKLGTATGISYIDSTSIAVCKPKRISSNRVFKGIAKLGKTTIGWFFGFKCHIVVSERGELLSVQFTPGNVDDRKPVPQLSKKLFGKLFGDKGYISQSLFEELFSRGVQFFTGVRDNMKNSLLPIVDKLLLRKRSIIESIFDQLKNICQIEHSRHRSCTNFFVHLIAALAGYVLKPLKPAISGLVGLP
jgi:hypothetical protein